MFWSYKTEFMDNFLKLIVARISAVGSEISKTPAYNIPDKTNHLPFN